MKYFRFGGYICFHHLPEDCQSCLKQAERSLQRYVDFIRAACASGSKETGKSEEELAYLADCGVLVREVLLKQDFYQVLAEFVTGQQASAEEGGLCFDLRLAFPVNQDWKTKIEETIKQICEIGGQAQYEPTNESDRIVLTK